MSKAPTRDPSGKDRPVLFGRDGELAAISRFIETLQGGVGGVVLVEGDAGLGKSSLLDALAGVADRAGVRSVRGQCSELDASRPFGPLIGAFDLRASSLDPGAAEIGRALGRNRGQGGLEIQSGRIDDAILDHVEHLVARGPLLLLVDDLQWADLPSLRLLTTLGRQATQVPLGVVMAYRTAPRSAELDGLLGSLGQDANHVQLRLPPLGESDVTALLQAMAGAPPGPRLSRLAEGAGGNPFFVVQLVASLRAESRLTVESVAEAVSADVPMNLRAAIERRVRALPEATRRLIRLAAALGSAFPLDQLGVVSGLSPLEVVERLRPAFDEGLLGDDGPTGVAFRHDLVREAVYLALPAAERTELHHRIGRSLAATDAPAAHIAEHLAFGAVRGDVEAVRWLRKAGIEAGAYDTATAVAYLERAYALSPPADPRRHGLGTALVNQLAMLGRHNEAEHHSRAILAETRDPTVEALLRVGLAILHYGSNRFGEARTECVRAAAIAPEAPVRLSALASAAFAMASAGDATGAASLAAEVLASAERDRIVFVQAVASMVLALTQSMTGHLDTALGLGERALLLTGDAEYFWGGVLFPHLFIAPSLLAADRDAEARSGLQTGRAVAVQRNLRLAVPAYDGLLSVCDFLDGRWDDALITSTEAKRSRREAGPGFPRAPGAAVATLIAVIRGDPPAEDGRGPTEAGDESDAVPFLCVEYANLARAATAGSAVRAAEVLSTAWDEHRPFHLPGFGAAVGPTLARLLLETEDPDGAMKVTDDLRMLAGRAPGIRSLAVAALRVEGVVRGAPEPLLAAIDLAEGSTRPYERAGVIEDAGIVLAARDPKRARLLLDHALDVYQGLDARRDAGRLAERMRAIGFKPRRPPPARARFGWDAVTPTELRVVDGVVRGQTNGEMAAEMYISRHTVESHLKHIFAKLGVRSRSELAAQGALHRS